MVYADFTKPEGLKAFDEYIASKRVIQGYLPTTLDLDVFQLMGKAPAAQYTHALRFYNFVASLTEEQKKNMRDGGDVPAQIAGAVKAPGGGKKKAAAPAAAAKPATSPAAAPAAASGDVAAIEQKIKEQGDLVRKLKSEKVDKATLQPAIDRLLALKKELQAAGGSAAPAPAAAPAEGGKKSKKNKKKGGDAKKEEPKKEEKKDEKKYFGKYDEKFMKAVKKEGGKKGQDIIGVYEMGGLEFFCTTVDTPDGDVELVNVVMEAMNVELDPAAEEKRGGSGPVGKMLFSAGTEILAMQAYVPADKVKKINAAEWMKAVAEKVGGKVLPGGTAEKAQAAASANPEKGLFTIKMKDEAIAAGVNYLKERGCFPDQDDDSGSEYCYGDDDFDDDAFAI